MPFSPRRLVAACIMTLVPAIALAAPQPTTAVVPSPKGAPAALRSCSLVVAPNGNASLRYEATDLDASRALERVTLVVRVYDDVGAKSWQRPVASAGMGVAPGETGRFETPLYELGYSKAMAARSATCTLSAATFQGGASWAPGKRWKGRLLTPSPEPSP